MAFKLSGAVAEAINQFIEFQVFQENKHVFLGVEINLHEDTQLLRNPRRITAEKDAKDGTQNQFSIPFLPLAFSMLFPGFNSGG